ncbi:hypothetical protein QYE76_011978 [Lolium multiflorum]|uniref:Uncharacterized protein n=1 Tax=Lolium multiflorum TaxID=4521 RepID=A0AAD8X3H3_LOLMU|nr:hypothetical protein QYE76_011978 [Lolium multiflorum]
MWWESAQNLPPPPRPLLRQQATSQDSFYQAEARGIKQRLDPSLLRKSSEKSEHSWLVLAWFTAEDLEYNRVVCQSADLSTLLGVFTNSLAATLCWQGMLAGHKVATEKVGVLFRSWEASSMVEKEIKYFCVAMGHENESFEDFVKSHDAYQEYLMFFPMNNGLASVAGNVDKLSSLQKRFDCSLNGCMPICMRLKGFTVNLQLGGWATTRISHGATCRRLFVLPST